MQTAAATTMNARLQPLRAFVAKHRPTLCEAGVRALKLNKNPSNSLRSILLVEVRARASAARAEQSYYVTGAAAVTFDALIAAGSLQAMDMSARIHDYTAQQRALGMTGAFFVVLNAVDQDVANITPVGWEGGVVPRGLRTPWKDWLARRMNEGIVN